VRLIAIFLPLVCSPLRLLGPIALLAAVAINFPVNRTSIESELVPYPCLVYSTITVRLDLKAVREGDPTVFHVVPPLFVLEITDQYYTVGFPVISSTYFSLLHYELFCGNS
jgi:hypothetical protein